MTYVLPTRRTSCRAALAALAAIVLAVLVVSGFVVQAEGQTALPTRIAVIVDTSKGPAPALVEHAAAVTARAGADLRVTRTATEQLSVTHYFAAKGYDAIVGVGLDRAIAVDPVAARYPDTRVTTVTSAGLDAALAAAAR